MIELLVDREHADRRDVERRVVEALDRGDIVGDVDGAGVTTEGDRDNGGRAVGRDQAVRLRRAERGELVPGDHRRLHGIGGRDTPLREEGADRVGDLLGALPEGGVVDGGAVERADDDRLCQSGLICERGVLNALQRGDGLRVVGELDVAGQDVAEA